MKKKGLIYLGFFLFLVGVFYFGLFYDNDNWKSKLPTLSYVKPFSFTNQDSVTVTEKDLHGKVVVVNYFFVTCKGICPPMNNNMRKVYDMFKDEPDFMILTHTCQPEKDSVAKLKWYADSMKVDTKKWVFVTGRKDSLYSMARSSYLLDDPKNAVTNIEDDFIHTQFFALVDKSGNIRGQIYDGLKPDEVEMLKQNIKILLKEKQGPSGFVNGIFGNTP